MLGYQLTQLRNLAFSLQENMLHKERNGENAVPQGSVKEGISHEL